MKIVISIFGPINIEKYNKINETWGKLACENEIQVLFFLEHKDSNLTYIKDNCIYLDGIDNYEEFKHHIGLKYIYENINPEFVLICNSNTYINIYYLKNYLKILDSNENLYIGGHGNSREISGNGIYFHDGSCIIISNNCLKKIYPYLQNMYNEWKITCIESKCESLINAYDVCIAYYLQNPKYEIKTTVITRNYEFFGCNYEGKNHSYYHGFVCCGSKVRFDKIISCHNMSIEDYDNYTDKLNKSYTMSIKYCDNYMNTLGENNDFKISDYIDGIFYINLDKRTDRRAEIEFELNNMELQFERFPAIETPGRGIVGCGYSHLSVFKLAKERKYKNVLIFEDDFYFIISKQQLYESLQLLFTENVDFDVCMLGYNLFHEEECIEYPFLKRVRNAQTASAYIINEKYYDALIELYEWAIPLLDSTGMHWEYANDQVWKRLQVKDRWYCFKKRIGKQRSGFSDNSNCFQEYEC